jgi:hypothetical protein
MNYAQLQQQMRTEIEQRLQVLPEDVGAWTAAERVEKMGLSSTQRLALVDMMDELFARQRTAFDQLTAATEAPAFADEHAELLLEMAGAHELWRVFRFILAEHEDDRLREAVQAAGRVAEDCYALCIRRARTWGVLDPSQFREVPLVFLEAVESPATANRRDSVQAVSAAVREFRNMKLALPIVLLPFDYAASIWSFCGLHHEVGHNIDQDLRILPDLRGQLPDIGLTGAEVLWRRWAGEILADSIGVALGGAGFAASLGALSLLLTPSAKQAEIDGQAVHPPFAIRVRLIAEMLRLTGIAAHATMADELIALWETLSMPAWVDPFVADAPKVATLFLATKVPALKDHAVLELNPNPALDHTRTQALAAFFLEAGPRPEPRKEAGMHPRLVPAAALLAVRGAEATANVLRRIHASAVAYLKLFPPGDTLGAADALLPQRRSYLRALTRSLDFSGMRRVDAEDE